MGCKQQYIQSNYTVRLAYSFLVIMLIQIFFPTMSYALTSGPTQPEVHGFTQYGTNNMVDPFSGGFSYNIPLIEIPGPDGGYPINLSYSSGSSMDQEASWVGLGWNLNVGVINRDMRGLPDDFDGDVIRNKKYIKPSITIGAGITVGAEFEVAGVPLNDFIGLSKGIKMYYNNYKGMGVTQEGGFNVGGAGPVTIGVNMSQDNLEGGKVSPSIGLKFLNKEGNASANLNIGMNFSSRYGLQGVSLNASISKEKQGQRNYKGKKSGKTVFDDRSTSLNLVSANFSYAGAAASPTMNDEMKSSGFNATLQIGGEIKVTNIDGEINGFWNKEELANNGDYVESKGYGFNYLHDTTIDDRALMDFDRTLDQPVNASVKTIAQPLLNYDIFSVRGQGIGSMLRPFRSDIGMLKDNSKYSDGWNASIGVEYAFGDIVHAGGSGYGGISESYAGDWKRDNDIHSIFKYKEKQTGNPYFEPVVYQSYGEFHALDKTETENLIQGFKPTYIKIAGDGFAPGSYSTLKEINAQNTSGLFVKYPTKNVPDKRMPRNINVQHFTNEQLSTNDNILRQFDIRYTTSISDGYNLNNLTTVIDRANLPHKQIGGFEAVNSSGIRYIYGLPAYNLENKECTYSAQRVTNNDYKVECTGSGNDPDYNITGYETFLEKNEIPKYAHSYLLTSVLGTDYIDMDNNGVSDKDLGYWVKFNYLKTSGQDVASGTYKWRAPFKGANLNEKLQSKDRDDVGSYTYGERENFYVSSIETKTHVAEFYVSKRNDAKGAEKEIQSLNYTLSDLLTSNSYKLDSIRLYTKAERYNINGSINNNAVPIKVVHFEYAGYAGKYQNNTELCKGIDNSIVNGGGKLTLKSVWFSYQNNEKGKQNAYVFDYHENNTLENPNYNAFAYNRWGDYQPEDANYTKNKYFPYVRQDLPKDTMDIRSAVWNLKEIELPTGAKMKINYEANDYAYVQNKPAMQMYKIAKIGQFQTVQDMEWWKTNKVYFELPSSITTLGDANSIVKKYVDNTKQLSFKIRVDLTARGDWEYVSGYADIESIVPYYDATSNKYFGQINLKPQHVKQIILNHNVHPFAVTAWNFLLMNRPEIIEGPNLIVGNPESTDKMELVGMMVEVMMKSLFTVLPMMQKYYVQASQSGFGLNIDLPNSFIRLNNVTGAKYGGGSRVKSVDIVAKNMNGIVDTFGTVYDYTTLDENGVKISSGVATYEPSIGGDENALKHALYYENKVAMRNFIPTFSELPVNENYFPSPSVGYSKVTIKSRATDMVSKGLLPSTISTTGQSVQEFYTAKDFPTITDYTPLVKGGLNLPGNMITYKHNFPIPIIGNFTNEQLCISQGFSVELNDMHGKPKATYMYGQNNEGKIIDSTPISYEKYIYKSEGLEAGRANGYMAKKLVNEANVMYSDDSIQKKLLGVDYEYFGDARETNSENSTFGFSINFEIFTAGIPIGLGSLIPTIGRDVKGVRLAATNKIIHRFGLIDSTIQFSEGSLVQTSNEVYDGNTGTPILTKLNDEYGKFSYNYTLPAYWQYDGMGAAYLNSGLSFKATIDTQHIDTKYVGLGVNDSKILDYLTSGDVIAIDNGTHSYLLGYIIQIDNSFGTKRIWIATKAVYGAELTQGDELDCIIIKSGRKNMLSVPAGTIVSKSNPLMNRTNFECK